ncbi:hypothetical protein CDAR_315441 [Caerostris darwini]|uniref:Fibrinogen C-terminal domain-containing protein n=1 Tax=Caerostris darwini TaxID=1538125 RepID=A0AAV4VFI0_9ARAC|nr:hypothetical protein CDAR_315441 [Caerostris darwini]
MGSCPDAIEKIGQHSIFCGIICGLLCATGIIIVAVISPRENTTDCADSQNSLAVLQLAEDLLSKTKEFYHSCAHKSATDVPGVTGVTDVLPQERPRDCSEILDKSNSISGVYTVWPTGNFTSEKYIRVYCDMSIEGEIWMVIQRRFYPGKQKFDLKWENYKKGFGDLSNEFWLGNENIYTLTNQAPYEVRFDLEDANGEHRFAVYSNFRIDDEASRYLLHINNYYGNAGDGMKFYNGQRFATRDNDLMEVASKMRGPWWFFEWSYVNLNGLYMAGENSPQSMHWYLWKKNVGLAGVQIKMRLKS